MSGLLIPSHYDRMEITPQEYIAKNKLSWNQGNIIKYASRYKLKNGMEDVKKAITYLTFILEEEYNVKTKIEYEEKD